MNIWHLKLGKKTEPEKEEHLLELGKELTKDIDNLINECKARWPKANDTNITKAYHWCIESHKNKVRKSGEPYYKHSIAVARIVVNEISLDEISVVSALLHDVVNYGDKYNLQDIRSEFGNTIAEIVEGVSKIQNVEEQKIEQLENYRKLLMSLFKDVRIILIKLADRLHNMRTLDFLDPARQRRISEETLEIFAPFAHRFGLGNIKWELEDLSFKHLNRAIYDEIGEKLQLKRPKREEYVKEFIKSVEHQMQHDELIKANNIKYEIYGRPKHIYSIYNKTILREKPVEELFDLFAIRIILDTEDINYCYIVYGIVSKIFRIVPGSFKDYISAPKANGYQSIHTAFIGPDEKMVEVQIRTRQMHEIAEKGVAAHFKYKRGFLPAESILDSQAYEQWLDSVRDIFENTSDEPPEELLERVKKNLVLDEIHVFTPSREFKTFPKDSTPLDFAYAIHTDLGNHCVGAKVNGKIVPLNYKMNSGDVVEILTSKTQNPKKDWLKFVVTHKAKSNILKNLKDEVKKIKEIIDLKINDENGNPAIEKRKAINGLNNGAKPSAGKTPSLPVVFAGCCNPVRNDDVVGLINPGKEIIVHRSECRTLIKTIAANEQALFDFDWSAYPEKFFKTKLLIEGEQNSTILGDITAAILSVPNISIQAFKFDTKEREFTGNLVINVENKSQLELVIARLESTTGIKKVSRLFT